MTAPGPAMPRRRRFTLSLRTLMVVVLVAGGWLGWRVKRAETQKRGVAAVEKAGGDVAYDPDFPDGHRHVDGQPRGPAWLRRQVGDEYFREVVEVNFYTDELTDADLVAVGALDRLERLQLSGARITDAGLAHLEGLAHLQEIDFAETPLSDASLAHLRPLTGLRELNLDRSVRRPFYDRNRITDAGLAHLAGLTQLQELTFDTRS